MTDRRQEESGHVERGASEEAAKSPLTPTEAETSRRPASASPDDLEDLEDLDDGRRRKHNPEDFSPDDFE